jgi:hypothetical protein
VEAEPVVVVLGVEDLEAADSVEGVFVVGLLVFVWEDLDRAEFLSEELAPVE